MECHKCKKDIDENDLKQVGPWHFCPGCFASLMKKAEDNATPPEHQLQKGAPVPPAKVDSQKKCTICEVPIAGESVQIGTLTVCQACYQELISRPEPVTPKKKDLYESPANQEGLSSLVVGRPGSKSRSARGSYNEEIVSSDEAEDISAQYREMTECHGCGRTIHQVGAKVHGGHFYCPDCFYTKKFRD